MGSYCERSLKSMSSRVDVISIAGKDYGPNCDLLESDLPDDLLKEAIQSEYSILSSTIPDTEQGSIDWLEQRKKRVTSSNFGTICKRRVGAINKCMCALHTLPSKMHISISLCIELEMHNQIHHQSSTYIHCEIWSLSWWGRQYCIWDCAFCP